MTSDDDFSTYEFSPNLPLDPHLFPGYFNMDTPFSIPNPTLGFIYPGSPPPCMFPTEDPVGQTRTLEKHPCPQLSHPPTSAQYQVPSILSQLLLHLHCLFSHSFCLVGQRRTGIGELGCQSISPDFATTDRGPGHVLEAWVPHLEQQRPASWACCKDQAFMLHCIFHPESVTKCCGGGNVCACSVAQSCPGLYNPKDSSQQGSSVHGTFQARILE